MPMTVSHGKLTLRVRNTNKKSGTTTIDFSFLIEWLGDQIARSFATGIDRFARRYAAAQCTYSARRVLNKWSSLCVERAWPTPDRSMPAGELARQLNELRRQYFEDEIGCGKAATTAANHWGSFLRLVDSLIRVRALPFLETTHASVAAPHMRLIIADRTTAANSPTLLALAPRSLNVAKDSFNDNLLEPISIVASEQEYLNEYQGRLQHAIETIRSCALRDFEELEYKYLEGKRLVAEFDKSLLLQFRRLRYFNKEVGEGVLGEGLLERGGDNPEVLKNLLGIVTYEMGGIPRPRFKYDRTKENKIFPEDAFSHWYAVQRYGKNRLLPYLGILTSRAAIVCAILLVLEHPKWNATSIYRAKLVHGTNCRACVTTTGLNQKEKLRFVVDKPRAGETKSEELSELSRRVLACVVEWTKPIRKALKREGKHDEAAMLWVAMSSLNYNLIQLSDKAFTNALGTTAKWRALGKQATAARAEPFLERHAELAPWKERINFRALRVNIGVLTYLETDGDLVATARAFGHRNVATTIGNYIPNALRLAIYERQIRRHQNRLLVDAVENEEIRLKVTDFRTVDELHEFLSSILVEPPKPAKGSRPLPKIHCASLDRLLLCDDPDALAVAMLYRDKLASASKTFLDRPRGINGLPPRFWCEFIDALKEPLPISMSQISRLVRRADVRKLAIKAYIRLPDVG